MEINKVDLWTDSIFKINFDNIDNKKIIEHYNEHQEFKFKNNKYRSNIGGRQVDFTLGNNEEIDELVEQFHVAIDEIVNNVYNIKTRLRFTNGWINVNSYGHHNAEHTHPGCGLAGVYYVNTEGEGDLKFTRDNAFAIETVRNNIKRAKPIGDHTESDNYPNTHKSIEPEEGTGFVFSPHFVHSTGTNFTDKDRIIIAMNFA